MGGHSCLADTSECLPTAWGCRPGDCAANKQLLPVYLTMTQLQYLVCHAIYQYMYKTGIVLLNFALDQRVKVHSVSQVCCSLFVVVLRLHHVCIYFLRRQITASHQEQT